MNIKKPLLSAVFILFSTLLPFAQDTDLSYSIPDPFCSLEAESCDAFVSYPFIVVEDHPEGMLISYTLEAVEAAPTGDTLGSMSGVYPDFVIEGNYPIGAYIFHVNIQLGENNTLFELPFEVVDCLAPVPFCINGLSVELMPVEYGTDADGDGDFDSGAMMVQACDFIVNCSGYSDCSQPVSFSIHKKMSVLYGTETPNPDQESLVFTCDENSVVEIRIYAWDTSFNPYALQPDGTLGGPNYAYCDTYVIVNDDLFCNCGDCGPGINGSIYTEDNVPVEGVLVNLTGPESSDMTTLSDGFFIFDYIIWGYDYTIRPYSDYDPNNGISTLDLILMRKHILGVELLDSPYKMIAADVNNSESITTLDIIQIQKLILGLEDAFSDNTSWRFVDASYIFPDPANPWLEDFPEQININDIASEMSNLDFVGIKTGDSNYSATANSNN